MVSLGVRCPPATLQRERINKLSARFTESRSRRYASISMGNFALSLYPLPTVPFPVMLGAVEPVSCQALPANMVPRQGYSHLDLADVPLKILKASCSDSL